MSYPYKASNPTKDIKFKKIRKELAIRIPLSSIQEVSGLKCDSVNSIACLMLIAE
jgi:hypothetical protein